jgi:hypothetical protein
MTSNTDADPDSKSEPEDGTLAGVARAPTTPWLLRSGCGVGWAEGKGVMPHYKHTYRYISSATVKRWVETDETIENDY